MPPYCSPATGVLPMEDTPLSRCLEPKGGTLPLLLPVGTILVQGIDCPSLYFDAFRAVCFLGPEARFQPLGLAGGGRTKPPSRAQCHLCYAGFRLQNCSAGP